MKTFYPLLTALSFLFFITGCSHADMPNPAAPPVSASSTAALPAVIDYREEMRNFVIGISRYAKAKNPQFAIIPQNGIELITTSGESDGTLAQAYVQAIDGVGQEDLFYGYTDDNVPTPTDDNLYLRGFLDRIKAGKKILVTDYCSSKNNMDKSYSSNNSNGYISFAASHRELDNIPGYPAQPYGVNSNNITSLAQTKNFLYLINPQHYSSKTQFINAVSATSYDVVLIDLFMDTANPFTAAEVDRLKTKAGGGKRLVICYLSIGEAEDYRYYWQQGWRAGSPPFIAAEDPDWGGNYFVAYWNADWQKIIYGSNTAYLDKILDSHFDGAYLDIIDAFDYFEHQ